MKSWAARQRKKVIGAILLLLVACIGCLLVATFKLLTPVGFFAMLFGLIVMIWAPSIEEKKFVRVNSAGRVNEGGLAAEVQAEPPVVDAWVEAKWFAECPACTAENIVGSEASRTDRSREHQCSSCGTAFSFRLARVIAGGDEA